MKAEYDFSEAEQGKFYHADSNFNLPIYLESDVSEFMNELAIRKNIDIQVLVNEWLRNNINLVKTLDS